MSEHQHTEQNTHHTSCCCCPFIVSSLLTMKNKQMSAMLAVAEVGGSVGCDDERDKMLDNAVIERVEDIVKSANDPHSYRYIELCNGLRLLLASNPASNTSAAALDIRIGNFHDPVHLQGLCHLCEHVLFTGSEKFAKESYSQFLGQRGGSSNAYTSAEHTNFHFDVPSEHFEESLARFTAFFECPIFRECSVRAELEMLQSEHDRNRWNDVWRTNQVERATANSHHAFSKFSTGSRTTLEISHSSDRNLRYELFTFFKTHYSANLMTVALVHNSSLDEMENMAKNVFKDLKNQNIPERIWPNRPFKNSQMRLKIYVVPVKNMYHVNLTFPMDDMGHFYKSAPEGYVAQMIGYKGPGGLFSYLRRHGFAHHLAASHKMLARGFSFFVITAQLTEMGERHIDEIVKLVFQYILLLRTTGPLEWFYQELKHLSEQQFEHKEIARAQTYATSLAEWIHLYPPRELLCAPYIFSVWRPDLVNAVFRYLSPDNLRITILSKNARFFATQVEPHYGTEYQVEKVPNAVLTAWRTVSLNEELKLPQPNDLIDMHSYVVAYDSVREESLPELFLHLNRVKTRAWFLPCTRFKLPKAFLFLKFTSPVASRDSRSSALMHLLVFLIRDSLTEYSYCGEMAGIFYQLNALSDGMELQIFGYSAKQHLFLERVLRAVYAIDHAPDKKCFQQVLEAYRKTLENWEAEPLKLQIKHLLTHCLNRRHFLRAQRLQNLKKVSVEDVQEFAKLLLKNHSVECLFFGNLTFPEAETLGSIVLEARKNYLQAVIDAKQIQIEVNPHLEEWFVKNPVEQIVLLSKTMEEHEVSCNESANPPQSMPQVPSLDESDELMVSSGSKHVLIVHNEVQSLSCASFFLQIGLNDDAAVTASLELFVHLVKVKLVDDLKITMALGYVVNCDIRKVNGTLGFRILVQSQYPIQVVNSAIESSLASLEAVLKEMTKESFDIARSSLLTCKKERWTSMKDVALALWAEIMDATYTFNRHQLELEAIEMLDWQNVYDFYASRIAAGGAQRKVFIVSIGPDPILNRLDETEGATHWTLRQVDSFQTDSAIPLPKVSVQNLDKWLQYAFDTKDNRYEPLCLYDPYH